ncbi:hypothetical protein QE152_g23512 [Popillia japonica]|uniref:Uncharacterized protein n=1 Tax=Popillia japonica TaxID=7064 RepID=A0AAW1KET9_POPJA
MINSPDISFDHYQHDTERFMRVRGTSMTSSTNIDNVRFGRPASALVALLMDETNNSCDWVQSVHRQCDCDATIAATDG